MNLLEYPFNNTLILQKKKSIRRELLKKEDLIEKNIVILSGSTIGEIKNILEIFLLNQGIKPIFFEGQYGKYYEDIMFDNEELQQFKPDFIYIHTSNKNIEYLPKIDDDIDIINEKFQKVLEKFKSIWVKIQNDYKCTIIQNNFELPNYRIMGNRDVSDIHGITNFITKLNVKFSEYAASSNNFYINDINYLSATYGLEKWSDLSTWYLYKYSLNLECIPILSHNISNIIKSLLGKNKKSIVLDLDDTLWGGVIGEVGSNGIIIGNESPKGMSYLEFQNYLKEISKTGVTLNICSKNEIDNALKGLENDRNLLKKEDFICIKANWEQKHINVINIARELNIMTDSMVFIDDNPVERNVVRENLPQVAVPNIINSEEYVKILDRCGFFEVTAFSQDDKDRNNFYKMNKEREILQQSFVDFTEYLKSLDMQCTIEQFKMNKIERIVQLINKTNQFNLTTKRYTENEVIEIVENSGYITICSRLEDKFGDNGIVSLIIGRIENNIVHIDLWVMSCRVFKRNLEFTMFDYLLEKCKELNIKFVRGYYFKTQKNLLVKDFYSTLGFSKVKEKNENTEWEYAIKEKNKKMNTVMREVYK